MLRTILCLLPVPIIAASVPFGGDMQRFMPSALGDARLAAEREVDAPEYETMFQVTVPRGEHHGLTVCGWFRIRNPNGMPYLTTAMLYAPESIRRNNPALAFCDAQGWPTNMVLSGTHTVDAFAWHPYAPGTASNIWPRGVYTVAGAASNEITVSIGGAAVALGPGRFNRNVVPGAGASVSVSGTGAALVGISRCPAAETFGQVDGVRDEATSLLTLDSIVTNEIAFCVWRLKLNETEHIYRSDLTRIDKAQCLGQTVTNAMPERARALSSDGLYQIGFMGFGAGGTNTIDLIDTRVFTRWLSDEECCRIHDNGTAEISRRGIPRWK